MDHVSGKYTANFIYLYCTKIYLTMLFIRCNFGLPTVNLWEFHIYIHIQGHLLTNHIRGLQWTYNIAILLLCYFTKLKMLNNYSLLTFSFHRSVWKTSNPMTCSMAHSMRVLLCNNNGRLQLTRNLTCVGCISIQLACWVQHPTYFEKRKVF